MSSDRRYAVTVRIDRKVWEAFRLFCRANAVFAEHGVESVLRAALERHGIPLIQERERRGLGKVEIEGSVR